MITKGLKTLYSYLFLFVCCFLLASIVHANDNVTFLKNSSQYPDIAQSVKNSNTMSEALLQLKEDYNSPNAQIEAFEAIPCNTFRGQQGEPYLLLEGSQCLRSQVIAPHRTITLELIINEPKTNTVKGTIVAGGGGDGIFFFLSNAGWGSVVDGWLKEGYRVVQRRWTNPGWRTFSNFINFHPDDGRFHRALIELLSRIDEDNPLCVSGASGGAMEIAESLGHWGTHKLVTHAQIIAGPSHFDIGYLVLPKQGSELYQCETIIKEFQLQFNNFSCANGLSDEIKQRRAVRSGEAWAELVANTPERELSTLYKQRSISRPGFNPQWGETSVTILSGDLDPSTLSGYFLAQSLQQAGVVADFTVLRNAQHDPFIGINGQLVKDHPPLFVEDMTKNCH